MAVYLTKPIEVEAIYFDGENFGEIQVMCGTHESYNKHFMLDTFNKVGTYFLSEDPSHVGELWVETAQNWVGVPKFSWIVKTDDGCFWLRPEEFRVRYRMKTGMDIDV